MLGALLVAAPVAALVIFDLWVVWRTLQTQRSRPRPAEPKRSLGEGMVLWR